MSKLMLGIVGHARSGKDTVANYVAKKYGAPKYAFANPIKDCVNSLFGWSSDHSDGRLKEEFVTVRSLDLQAWGEALARHDLPHLVGASEPLYEAFLKDLILAHAREGLGANKYSPRKAYQVFGTDTCRRLLGEDVWLERAPDSCVVSDVRYPNEAEFIREKGGVLIRVTREGSAKVSEHCSEQHIKDIVADAYIENNKDLESLYAKVDAAIKLLK